MSEKTAERGQERPATAATETTRPAGNQALAALTPAERAERELAKIDEEMDAILDRNPNREALLNTPGQALQPPAGRTVTPDVSAPVDAGAVNHLAMNVFVPGLGSLVRGRYALGATQLGMAIASVPVLLFVKVWLAILLAVGAYAWSVASGIGFLTSANKRSWK